ncbi:MAG: LacI family transcriptional regulator [Actinobacteria bacterium]|nr:LacI family transcriptional regulator [Actinomycetota bacterium]
MYKLKDVAEKANVSLATASLAINDSDLVNDKTKKKVLDWVQKLGYYPNMHARNLARGRSYNIVLMINSKYFLTYSNIFYLRVIGGIIKEAEKTEYSVVFSFYGDKKDFDLEKFKHKITNIDGIVVLDVIDKKNLKILKEKCKLPIILIDNHKKNKSTYGVDNDDYGGAYKATKYLIELGHKKIGYIGIPDSHPLGKECWEGFKKALEEYNLNEFCSYKKCKLGITSGREAIDYLININKNNLPSAFFCLNDYIAIGVMEELKNKGYKIPDDFSIIGMDDMPLSSEIDPPLTTVKIKMEEMGNIGINNLISIINNNYKGPRKFIVDNELIKRKSCKSF